MLRSAQDDRIWFITQPAHAALSGFFAAHWGNEIFAGPGRFAPSVDPVRLAAEVIFGIEQHDNGWWEWEADPTLSEADQLPVGLGQVLADPNSAADRWRVGSRRFESDHPYASLLIIEHARQLYRTGRGESGERELHPIFSGKSPMAASSQAQTVAEDLLQDLDQRADVIRQRLEPAGGWQAEALRPEHFEPSARMVQILDALSLALTSEIIPSTDGGSTEMGRKPFELGWVPRATNDWTTLRFEPVGERALTVEPYPFDVAPLRAPVLATVVEAGESSGWGPGLPKQLLEFELRKK